LVSAVISPYLLTHLHHILQQSEYYAQKDGRKSHAANFAKLRKVLCLDARSMADASAKEIKDLDNDLSNNKYNELEKIGIKTGLIAINPVNSEPIPIWVASYVLDEYGTGAVMGVPAHDQRDFEFAKKNNIDIRQVILKDQSVQTQELDEAYVENGYLINSNQYNGIANTIAKLKISEDGVNNGWAENKIQYRLRDWLISRQRYWGCPIPIVNCKKCGSVPLNQSELPVELPKDIDISAKKINALGDNNNWINTSCPKCGIAAKKETDTMETFMCSSWNF